MTKTIISCAVEMITTQSLVFAAGLVVVLICHALFNLSAEDAARNVFSMQLMTAGWVVRGWFEGIEKE